MGRDLVGCNRQRRERAGTGGNERERAGASGNERERAGTSGNERERAGTSGNERERRERAGGGTRAKPSRFGRFDCFSSGTRFSSPAASFNNSVISKQI